MSRLISCNYHSSFVGESNQSLRISDHKVEGESEMSVSFSKQIFGKDKASNPSQEEEQKSISSDSHRGPNSIQGGQSIQESSGIPP